MIPNILSQQPPTIQTISGCSEIMSSELFPQISFPHCSCVNINLIFQNYLMPDNEICVSTSCCKFFGRRVWCILLNPIFQGTLRIPPSLSDKWRTSRSKHRGLWRNRITKRTEVIKRKILHNNYKTLYFINIILLVHFVFFIVI